MIIYLTSVQRRETPKAREPMSALDARVYGIIADLDRSELLALFPLRIDLPTSALRMLLAEAYERRDVLADEIIAIWVGG